MNITFRPMTADEAWKFILGRHGSFHSRLKHFGYRYQMFIPKHPEMQNMYDKENLTNEDISKYRDVFMNQIYNVNDLKRLDSVLSEKAMPALQSVVDTLSPMAARWKVQFPKDVEIQTTYGGGGSYMWGKKSGIIFRMSNFSPEYTVGLLQHEFIHVLIEESIIQRYNVPQDLKECIVDVIGFEYFGIPVQKQFEKSFANTYITRESIETDLPGAVQRMMNDYTIFQTKMKEKLGKSGI